MLALIKEEDGEEPVIIDLVPEGGWLNLPDGSMVSPAHDGFSSGNLRLYSVAESDGVPDGFASTGVRKVEMVDGVPKWVDELVRVSGFFPELTHRQFWLAAWDIGITKQGVTAKVLSSYPEEERDRIAMEVELTTTFSRNHPLVDELCVMSGLSPVELDSLWEWASAI